MSSRSVKKRMMYFTGEDFYLVCYSIFLLLDSLDCADGKPFRDYRKLPHLIKILNDPHAIEILRSPTNRSLSMREHEQLLGTYVDGLAIRSEVLKLLFMLERKEYVYLLRGRDEEIDVYIQRKTFPDAYLGNDVFAEEKQRSKLIVAHIKRLSHLKLSTMLKKVYQLRGVNTWL